MGNQPSYQEFWPAPMRGLAKVSEWMDLARPILYCLLAVALVGLALILLDMALLYLRETRPKREKKRKSTSNTVFELTSETEATPTKQRLYAIKALFLLMFINRASHTIFSQDQDMDVSFNTAICNGNHQQVKALLIQARTSPLRIPKLIAPSRCSITRPIQNFSYKASTRAKSDRQGFGHNDKRY